MCVILANSYTIGKNFKLVNGKIYTVFKKFSGHTDTTKCFQMCQKIVKINIGKLPECQIFRNSVLVLFL